MLLLTPGTVSAASYNGIDFSDVYNAEYYYDHNPDLAQEFGWNEDLLWNHFITCGMQEGRQAAGQFNPYEYQARYPDLEQVYGDDMSAYYMHYICYGEAEGRKGLAYALDDFALVFNPQNYMNRNLDVRVAYGDDIYAALQHFINNGIAEGRQAINTFDVRAYKLANKDLREAFGDNNQLYINHYITYGQYEDRITTDEQSVWCGNDSEEDTYSCVFNATYYLAHNADVAEVYGTSKTAAITHFIECGMKEGRQGSPYFNVNYYRGKYSDLREVFGDDLQSYYLHYIRYGKDEGRRGSGYIEQTETPNPLTANGIDVSSWQGEIDWEAVKNDTDANIGFAIIRVGYGDNLDYQDDRWAIRNMDECERLGIPYGVYLYSYATNSEQAQSEAEHIIRMLDGRNPSMGVYIDIEDSKTYAEAGIDIYSTEGRRVITDITKSILESVSANGYRAGVYANVNYYKNVLYADELAGYRWIAGYGDYYDTCVEMGALIWQYSSTGSVAGIEGNVDMNIYMGEL